jgi:hypothetical protein
LVGNQFEATGATDNDYTSYHASGTRVLSGGTTTDTGSYSSSKHEASTGTDSVNLQYYPWYGGGSKNDNTSGDDTGEYFERGSYTNTNGAPTSKSMSFYAHARSDVTDLGTEAATEPGDAATSFTLNQTNGMTEEDWSSGTSTLASFSNNFTQKKSTWSSLAFNQQGDQWQPEVPGQVLNGVWGHWDNIPNLFGAKHSVTAMGQYGTVGSAPSPPPISTASSTATANYTTSHQTKTTGTSTGGSQVSTSTTSTTAETDNIDQSAFLQAVSPAGFNPSQPNAAGNLFTGFATSSEADDHDGWNRLGTASLSYNDASSETDSYSYLSTSDTTPASGQPVYQYQESRSMTTTTAQTGNYLTNPLGSMGPPTADEPLGGYAYLNDTVNQNVSVSGSVSLHEVAAATSGSWQFDYLGLASSSLTNNRTVSILAPVGATVGVDLPSGSYNMTGGKIEQSQIDGWGSGGGGSFGVSWNFAAGMIYTKSVSDSGTYPGGGTVTTTIGTSLGWTETVKEWGVDLGQSWSSTYTESGGSSATPTTTTAADGGGPYIPLNPPDPVPYTVDAALDDLQLGLTALGFVEGPVGTIADLLNAAISYGRGNTGEALFNVVLAIPGASWLWAGGKAATKVGAQVLKNGDEAAKLVGKGTNVVSDVGTGANKIAGEAGGIFNPATLQLKVLQKACFAAGTPIVTPEQSRKVETLARGVGLSSRPEDDPKAPVGVSTVDAVFVLTAQIWELHIGGRVIETTAEHPFYLVAQTPEEPSGWTPVNRLREGDLLLGHNACATPVERVVQTDRSATVYNVRVEPDHTFFVGGDDWGFSLWVHNNTCPGAAAGDVVAQEAKGGAYVLRDRVTGEVVRTGRSKNLAARKGQLGRDSVLGDYKFDAVYRTDSYATQRGLEQKLYELYPKAIFNKIRAIDPNNGNIKTYMAAADKFLEELSQ